MVKAQLTGLLTLHFLLPRWLTPAREIGILEAEILKNGFFKAIFQNFCLQKNLLQGAEGTEQP